MFPSKTNTVICTFPFRFSTKAVETFQSSKAAMILCQIKPRPVSSIFYWNSNGNHGNSNPGNNTDGSHSDPADSKSYPLELEREDSTAHKDMQSTATEPSHPHNCGEPSHTHNSGEPSPPHNSGQPSHPHNSREPSHTQNSGQPSHPHYSGIIREFALNSKAKKLLTNLKVTWRHDSFTSSFEGRGEVVLLYSIRGKLHNIQNAMEKEGTSSELKLPIF